MIWVRVRGNRFNWMSDNPGRSSHTCASLQTGVDDAIDEHFSVHTEIADTAFHQHRTHRVLHGANPNLDTGSVLDLTDDLAGHNSVNFGRRRIAQFTQRCFITVNDVVNIADVRTVIAPET